MNVKSIAYACCPPVLKPMLNRIEDSPIGYRLAKGVFWSMAGAVISRGLMLVASTLVARILTPEVFGEYGMVSSTIAMFGIFAGFGMGLTATKHVAEFRQSDPERAGRIIGMAGLFAMIAGGLMSVGLFIFSPWLAEHTINAPHLSGALRIGAIILFISSVNGAQTGALAGFEAFKAIAHVNLFVGLISFPILVCGAYFGGLTGAIWALAINLGFNWLLNHIALRREAHRHKVPLTFRHISREFPVFWRFTLPAVLAGVMVGPANWACSALLANQSNGYDQLGLLTAALIFRTMLLFISSMLGAPLLSMISNASSNVSEKLGTVNIISTWILGVTAAIPLLCFPEVAQWAFGADYATRSFQITFSLVIFTATVMMFSEGMARVLIANSLLWWGFISNTFWALVLIGSAVFLVRWGAAGLAASTAIAYMLSTLVFFPLYYSRNLVPKKTLFSVQTIAIWLVLFGLLALNFANVSLLFRSLAFVPSILIAVIAFMRIAKGHTAVRKAVTAT